MVEEAQATPIEILQVLQDRAERDPVLKVHIEAAFWEAVARRYAATDPPSE